METKNCRPADFPETEAHYNTQQNDAATSVVPADRQIELANIYWASALCEAHRHPFIGLKKFLEEKISFQQQFSQVLEGPPGIAFLVRKCPAK